MKQERSLKNYTSKIPASKTISRIEEILAEFGAKAIGKDYGPDKKVESITFQIEMNGKDHLVRLPANPQAVFDSMRKEVIRPHNGTFERLREQSDRTAWKIQQDWLEVELSLVRLKQKEPLQAFLSYVWDGRQTYYSFVKDRGIKMISEKSES